MRLDVLRLILVTGCFILPGCGNETMEGAQDPQDGLPGGEIVGGSPNTSSGQSESIQRPPKPETPASRAFDELMAAFDNKSGTQLDVAQRKLLDLGPDAVPALVDALRDGSTPEREMATIMLAQLGLDASTAIDELTRLLSDDSTMIRANAASVLSIMQEPPDAVVPALIGLLGQPEENWQEMAIVALGNLGPQARQAIPQLSRLLTSNSANLRKLTADTLGRIGFEAEDSLPILKRMIDDPDANVREAAKAAVRQLEVAKSSSTEIPDAPKLAAPRKTAKSTFP